ncbi:phage terminase large subunit family protein, partial [Escherichia coli]|uniref:phage terminase large subunit family protein n=1 Tax=Escherichia coli TaxID=562 RepID=UPI003CE45507
GRWETLPFQRAIMNAMGSDYIREVNVVKSARVGYAANAIQLHQDHIVGSFFRLSHRPSWRYLGIGEEEAR